MARGRVCRHGLVLEGVGLDQLLFLPPGLLPCVVIIQLIQALKEKEKTVGYSHISSCEHADTCVVTAEVIPTVTAMQGVLLMLLGHDHIHFQESLSSDTTPTPEGL